MNADGEFEMVLSGTVHKVGGGGKTLKTLSEPSASCTEARLDARSGRLLWSDGEVWAWLSAPSLFAHPTSDTSAARSGDEPQAPVSLVCNAVGDSPDARCQAEDLA